MAVDTARAKLEALAYASVRDRNRKRGAGDTPRFGVPMGDVRKVATEIGRDHDLAMGPWATGSIDARLLAILLLVPKRLSRAEVDAMVRDPGFVQVADWLGSHITRKHPEKEALRVAWLSKADPWAARASRSLTAERIGKAPEGLDLSALLDRLGAELASARPWIAEMVRRRRSARAGR